MDQNVNPVPPYNDQELPPLVEPPKKNNKTWLIILIVALVLCCCCIVVAVLGKYLYDNGDSIMQQFGALIPLVV